MKSAFFLTLASLFASLATATQIDKELLCIEACWIYDNVNHDACKNGCINGPRPTIEEAGQCRQCIDDCSRFVTDHSNMPLYGECRTGCYAKYFPQIIRASRKAPIHKQKEHIYGVPSHVQLKLGGHAYPVDKTVCEVSCQAQGADSILSESGEMDKCIKGCLKNPNTRQQELQMSLDCHKECTDNGKRSMPCFTSCLKQHATSRAPGLNFTEAISTSSVLIKQPTATSIDLAATNNNSTGSSVLTTPSTATLSDAATPSQSSKKASSKANKPMATDVEDDSIFGSETHSATLNDASQSSTPTHKAKGPGSDQKNAGVGQSYFGSFQFWVHAAGTIVVAMFIGLQVV